ncbi:phosphonate metabolism transcriptional regulator PhnF [Martelella mediterranea]|uniref:GntR family phosphonate transport system transcriptional regulator n=1 Tax=Martelella mediterranea TaxID=293089 RepID=A0A4R3NXK8_9HYPH|nr:phosphonate metabolism transcriptional regulator PhnF [Martelella mediterranea]TCT44987.1 GntR family phosphonate transport system transcriptional regulator [Martelella mediterranea]
MNGRTDGGDGLVRINGVALWRQIADRIRQSIGNHEYDETGMIPPETELAERFGVNRHTVRAAVAALSREGVLRSERGRGTFVVRQELYSFPISRRTRFSEGLGEQARVFDGDLLETCEEPASAKLAERLGLEAGARVIRVETVRRADGVALSRSSSWFPSERFAGISEAFLATRSVTAAFRKLGLHDYVRKHTDVTASHAMPDDCKALGLSPGAIVLIARSLNTDLDGVPVQYAVTRFAADRVRISIDSEA